ncbi:MAG: hypothetical protein WBD95_23095 [Xanthobacteraceae bacterium]
MTSFRQVDANRRNALKSTGPTTDAGKQQSRRNAVRHGLTSETVITTLEDEEDYKAFELSVASGFDAPTAVERELVLRLASLLWRLRRATAIDTGLLQLQSEIIGEFRQPPAHARVNEHDTNETAVCRGDMLPSLQSDLEYGNDRSDSTVSYIAQNNPNKADETSDASNTEIARCFLRLANLDNGAFERASRYETALWRQIGQILLTLDFLRRTR